jgi:hypothetical protein
LDKVEKYRKWEAALAAGDVFNPDDRIEKRIRVQAAHHIPYGGGEWADGPENIFGRPIYRLSVDPMTIVFSQEGLTYEGPPQQFKCRYDEIKSVKTPTLKDYMHANSNAETILIAELIMRGQPSHLEIRFHAHLGWAVNLIAAITQELP